MRKKIFTGSVMCAIIVQVVLGVMIYNFVMLLSAL